jgi:signal transduction histidine kinase/CheY-like chemotaxis protein
VSLFALLQRRTLRRSLALLLIGALAPLVLASTFFLWRQWEFQREASINRLRDLCLALQLSLDREIAQDETALQVLATSSTIDMQDWRGFYSAAVEATKVRPGSWVLLGDTAGRTLINTLVPFGTSLPVFSSRETERNKPVEWNGRTLPWFDRDVLARPLRTGLPHVSDLFVGPVARGPVVALSVPVKRSDRVIYSLAFAYAPETFVRFLQRQPHSGDGVMLLIDGNGAIIARNREDREVVARAAQRPFDQPMRLPPEGVSETVTFRGVPAVFAHRRSDLTNWIVAVGLPREEIFAPVVRSLLLWLSLLSGMVLVTAVLAHLFWRRVAVPLTELARQARASERSFDIAPDAIEEMEALCKALNDAAQAERAHTEEVARRLEVEKSQRLLASQHAAELRAADRRKDEFLAMLGHELRNPLAAIVNALAVMQKLGPAEPTLQRVHEIMDRQARQLARLIDDLLDVARINTGKIVLRRERVDLTEVVEHAAEAAQPAMERRDHLFSVQKSPEALWVDGDEARLTQIIGNLLDNAAKYTDPGGKVSLSASREAECAVVRVADTGKGIPVDLLPHVFDLFTQGDLKGIRASGGLGIGLHVVKRLAEKHGGTVTVSSAGAGAGSVFEVTLPLAQASALQQPSAPAVAQQPALKLLVVDDNCDAAESLALLLQADGHSVSIAYDGKTAIESARAHAPDAVLLDINMPGMNGFAVARRFKAEPLLRDIPLIAMSGYTRSSQRAQEEESGIQDHLTKPVSPEELRRTIANIAQART